VNRGSNGNVGTETVAERLDAFGGELEGVGSHEGLELREGMGVLGGEEAV
jgi:hypothetical protein